MQWRGHISFKVVLYILIILPGSVEAAFEYSHGSTIGNSLAGAFDLFASAPLDAQYLPAQRAHGKVGFEASVCQLYNLNDFTLSCAAGQTSYHRLTFGLGTTQLTGSDFYRERNYFVNASFAAHTRIAFGITAAHRELEFSGTYADLSSTSLSAGLRIDPGSDVSVAVSLLELNRPQYYADQIDVPLSGLVAIAYRFSDDLTSFAAYTIAEHLPDRLSLGQAWQLHERVTLRLGLRNQPLDLCGGLSVTAGGFTFDYSYSNNVYLGGTHQLGLRYGK